MVDGSDSEDTSNVAVKMGARVVRYPAGRDVRGFARNLGAKSATGDALLFLDSDMELEPNLIKVCEDAIAHGTVAAVIPERNLGSGLLGRTRKWERSLLTGNTLLTFARLIRADLFASVGGFSEQIIGFEDLDLQATLVESSAPISTLSTYLLHHEENLGVITYVRKRRHYRRSARLYRSKHPAAAKVLFSPLERMRLYAGGLGGIGDVLPFGMAVILRVIESV